MSWIGYFEEIPDPPRGGGGDDGNFPKLLFKLVVFAGIVFLIVKACTGN